MGCVLQGLTIHPSIPSTDPLTPPTHPPVGCVLPCCRGWAEIIATQPAVRLALPRVQVTIDNKGEYDWLIGWYCRGCR